jgi:BMFP domain-containing protein YqiC
MLNSKTLDDLTMRIGKAFEASPVKDVEKNIKALLQGGLAKLDFVTRQEFDVQRDVLARTREKVEALEQRVVALEGAAAPPASSPASDSSAA